MKWKIILPIIAVAIAIYLFQLPGILYNIAQVDRTVISANSISTQVTFNDDIREIYLVSGRTLTSSNPAKMTYLTPIHEDFINKIEDVGLQITGCKYKIREYESYMNGGKLIKSNDWKEGFYKNRYDGKLQQAKTGGGHNYYYLAEISCKLNQAYVLEGDNYAVIDVNFYEEEPIVSTGYVVNKGGSILRRIWEWIAEKLLLLFAGLF